ncbi:MAG: tRNA (adenosine(37)-N6)-dimethylallyltransferase MiaA [Betaproteobacteria bacterium]|nr:tRNA (adenosine(37)-N6)-dimethylallyltransferase MiaA [Betaproteobacteria bacterium]
MSGLVCCLLGPTASGKSRLALDCAGGLPVEIVSIDSAQVYRGLDIGTAKPSRAERDRVPHHLIDLIDPDAAYSAGQFRQDALRAIEEILARRRIPLLVGGTMLYYRALAMGLDVLPRADPALRAAIDAEAARRGWPSLHEELGRVDPESARRVGPHDAQRIQRALEVWRATGQPLSRLHGTAIAPPPFVLKTFAIVPQDRALLHERIAKRFDAMLEAGLVEELAGLRERHRLAADMPSMRCVGYRQAWDYLQGRCDRATMRDKAIAATRQLAKRQFTWLRSFRGIAPIVPEQPAPLLEALRVSAADNREDSPQASSQ